MGHPWQFYHGEVLIFSWSCYAENIKKGGLPWIQLRLENILPEKEKPLE